MYPWQKNVRKVDPYVPGEQPKTLDVTKLNTNENPYPPSPGVAEALNSYILSHILEFTQDNTAFLQKKRPSGDRRFCFIVLYLVLLLLYYSIVSELYQNSSRSLPAILLLGRQSSGRFRRILRSPPSSS